MMLDFSISALHVSSTRVLTVSALFMIPNKEQSTMVILPYKIIEVTHKCLPMLFLKLNKQVVISHWWTSLSISIICLHSQSLVCGRFKNISIFFSLWTNLIFFCPFLCRGYYIIIVPLKKSRGKFIKPWESPDEMELDEVTMHLLVVSFITYLTYQTSSSSVWKQV